MTDKMNTYQKNAKEIADLVTEKNKAYGDSFNASGIILKILYPNGVKSEDYKTLLAITRVIDKLFRIATDEGAFREEPWKDICGYALLMVSDRD